MNAPLNFGRRMGPQQLGLMTSDESLSLPHSPGTHLAAEPALLTSGLPSLPNALEAKIFYAGPLHLCAGVSSR